ncbi:MAG: hypothetical protein WCG67_10235, partial [Ferruginibacter sp.]
IKNAFNKKSINYIDSKSIEKKVFSISSKKKYSYYIIIFVICVLAPLNIWMYTNGIGISATEPPVLRYRLVGVTHLFRSYVAPLIIGYLYYRSKRGVGVVLVLLLYALFYGLLSLSKGAVVITCLPVLFLAYLDKRIKTLFLVALYMIVLYSVIGWFRQFVFIADIGSLNMINMGINNLSFESLGEFGNLLSSIEAISFRLNGANLYVLGYQYDLPNNFVEIINFYSCSSEQLNEIIYYDIFGLPVPQDGMTMGVSLGYLGTIFLLSGKSLGLVIILSIITALLLCGSDLIVKKYLNLHNQNYALLGYGIAFLLLVTLTTPDMNKFYFILFISIACLPILKLLSKKKVFHGS